LPGTYTFTIAAAGYIPETLVGYTLNGGDSLALIVMMQPAVSGLAEDIHPKVFYLDRNYPNPFNARTKLGFQIVDFGLVRLKVYDVLGREVATLVDCSKEAGTHEVTWDATGLPSGLYFYRLEVSSGRGRIYTMARKMAYVR
jgi:hypothetical protein